MPLFFALSGLTTKHCQKVKKVLVRLYAPYIYWSVIATVYEVVCTPSLAKTIVVGNAVRTLIGYGIAPFWFLFALSVAQLIHLWSVRASIKPEIVMVINLGLSVILSVACERYFTNVEGYLSLCIRTVCRQMFCMTFYYVGILARKYVQRTTIHNPVIQVSGIVFCTVISVAAALWNSGVNLHKCMVGNLVLFYIAATAGCIAIWLIAEMIGRCSILEYLGRNSMGIMCFHYKTIPLWAAVAWIFNKVSLPDGTMKLAIQMIVLTSLSVALTKLIEQVMPWMIGKGRRYGRTQM